MKGRRTERTGRLWAALAACALASLAAAAGAEGDGVSGRVVHVGARGVDPGVFEAAEPVHAEEELAVLDVFDQSLLPCEDVSIYRERPMHQRLTILRPSDGASFPRNIAPPRVRWQDQVGNVWLLSVKAPGWSEPLRVITDRREWRPDFRTWEAIRASGTGDWVELEVRGCRLEGKRPSGPVFVDRARFRVSPHPADPLIVFRFVSPLFHGAKTPDVLYRDITTFERRMFLPGKGLYCTNCHSFPSRPASPDEPVSMAIAVRKSFTPLRQLGFYDFGDRTSDVLPINSFFMCWDGPGRRLAVTAGEKVLVREPITLETQEFHVITGDIVIVDRQTLTTAALPGASTPQYVETFPAWSPDSRTIVFARDKEIDPARTMPVKRYTLLKVPYNDGEGGEPSPLLGADDGKSNFAPRFSPDGRWIVFCKAEAASLVEPTADLWIISTEEGARARKLECNCPRAMDSHHSWSSESRWLLFASKRDDGIFARIYLTQIDEQGHASPPIELPTLDDPMMCYNVPEFLRSRPVIDAEDILRKVSHQKKPN